MGLLVTGVVLRACEVSKEKDEIMYPPKMVILKGMEWVQELPQKM
jgi:hypothetical protein